MCEGVPHLDYRDAIANCNLITMVTNMVFKIYVPHGFPWHLPSCLERTPSTATLRASAADYHADKHTMFFFKMHLKHKCFL